MNIIQGQKDIINKFKKTFVLEPIPVYINLHRMEIGYCLRMYDYQKKKSQKTGLVDLLDGYILTIMT